jgi:N-acetylgalactosamine kinase
MTALSSLKKAFLNVFPEAPEPRACRAPGRVNLIGEHVDYNGLPVLPMTLDREIRIAFAPRDDHRVRLRSAGDLFPASDFVNERALPSSPPGSWANYCKAAVEGLNTYFDEAELKGMDLLVAGDIPIAAGLSSSSALVVACALAYLSVMGKRLGEAVSRVELASLLSEAEQYVGTRGGGMDQAIILLGQEGCASRIDFAPLRSESLPLFEGYLFVVCDSLVKAEKTGDALHRYNEGPLTCRLVRALVEKRLQHVYGRDLALPSLAALWRDPLSLTHKEVEQLFSETFPNETMGLAEAAGILGIDGEVVQQRWLNGLREPEGGFRLRARARHQLTEHRRVEAARECLLTGDAVEFGNLMNASHRSCAEDYLVSSSELDALVNAARAAGAVGARLTGAGFGGSTVNLVPAERVDVFIDGVEADYYCKRWIGTEGQRPREAIHVVRSSQGAGYG